MSDLISRMDAIQACEVGPSDEWSKATRSGYCQAATDCARNILRIATQPDLRPLSEAEAFALSAPTNAPHASMADMQEWAESIQLPDPRDEVIARLVEALEVIKQIALPIYGDPDMDAKTIRDVWTVSRTALAAAKAVQK